MACAGGELTMPQHTCGMPQDEPHKVLSIAAVATRCCCCCLVSLLCAYFHSNIYSCKNLWLPHGQLSNTLTKSVQIPQCVSLFIPLFLYFISLLRNLTLSGLGTLPHTRRALVLCPPEICTRLGSVGRRVACAMAETKR